MSLVAVDGGCVPTYNSVMYCHSREEICFQQNVAPMHCEWEFGDCCAIDTVPQIECNWNVFFSLPVSLLVFSSSVRPKVGKVKTFCFISTQFAMCMWCLDWSAPRSLVSNLFIVVWNLYGPIDSLSSAHEMEKAVIVADVCFQTVLYRLPSGRWTCQRHYCSLCGSAQFQ